MTDIDYDGEKLRGAGTFLASKVASIPTSSPLNLNAITEGDVTAAANNFNLWLTYTGLISRAQLTALAESIGAAADAMDATEEGLVP